MQKPPLAFLVLLALFPETTAQTPKVKPGPSQPRSTLCTKPVALDTLKQQMALARTIDDAVGRIAVQLKVSDSLWPADPVQAKAFFLETFDVAVQHFKANGTEPKRSGQLTIETPDQRFLVITAFAKRDPKTARKLASQVLEDEAQNATSVSSQDQERSQSQRLLNVAMMLTREDPETAVNFARGSLRYPASLYLSRFFYDLARANRSLANQFYREALLAYRKSPMDQFLYLSSFPFGNDREAGEMPTWTTYSVPSGFLPDPELQRLFLTTLLARTNNSQEVVPGTVPDDSLSDAAQMWLALSRLEDKIKEFLPDLLDDSVAAKERLHAMLTPASQERTTSAVGKDKVPVRSFDEQVEAAEKLSDVSERDGAIALAVLNLSSEQTVERVLNVIDKVSEASVREALTNWFLFFRSQRLIGEKKLTEAKKLASRLDALDQRAYVYSQIAEVSLKQGEDQSEARQILNEVSDAVNKAPKTVVTARVVLALAYQYAQIDKNRGIEELTNAVRLINSIEKPDFSQDWVSMKIEGKLIGIYGGFYTPGFSPPTAFKEVSKIDFDSVLVLAGTFMDKTLRASTTIAVIEPCLENQKIKTVNRKTD
ncbi:MAG TPA: hypothetical protein VLB68_11865 [Pyrinomonadaceae bacterium]|nr:hypothetical protein [Pyrinomonadaceae bacterium]